MKTAVSILIALLAGLMLGSWSVKTDLRKATAEISTLKAQLASKGTQPSTLSGISSMLNLPEIKPEPVRRHHKQRIQMSATFTPPTDPGSATNATPSQPEATVHHSASNHSQTMQAQFETAANLWKVRTELARNNFVAAVTTNDDQALQFDVSMAAMNLRLSNSIRIWVDQIKDEKDLTPEKSIFMLHDLSSTLVWAYKDLDRSLPADWRVKAGTKFQVFDFINPEVARPLIETGAVFNRANRKMDIEDDNAPIP